ncbi:MAG: hypothetical protein JNL57_08050 [Bacteroidetes bacterium]|nr:hypothetical protein [Bacteroidota bacterium]
MNGNTFLVAGVCLLLFACGAGNGVPDKPTFNKHVAPLMFKHCTPCHREGGVAPFSLINYEQTKRKAKTIAKVTEKRYMPPWPADASYTHFVGENFLSDQEIAVFRRWYETGMTEGAAEDLPRYEPPTWRSQIGKPDMVLPLDSVRLFPNLKDRFFIIKIPGMLDRDTWVRAVEFVAGNQDLVHHFNGHLLLYKPGANRNLFQQPMKVEVSSGEYKTDFKVLNLFNNDGSIPERVHSAVNYLPGVLGTAYPAGLGTFRISREFAFVGNDMHYGPADRLATDRSYLNLFFSNKPPSRPVAEIMLGTNGVSPIVPPLKIAPGKVQTHSTRFRIDKDISVLTINPHLHLLGKSFLAYAIKPNGDTIRLIRISRWDFRWQYFYTFQKMVHIPAGSEIIAEAVFDNTDRNPNNPNQPPKEVGERLDYGGASMRATDEMFQFIITYTLYQPGDENFSLEPDKSR